MEKLLQITFLKASCYTTPINLNIYIILLIEIIYSLKISTFSPKSSTHSQKHNGELKQEEGSSKLKSIKTGVPQGSVHGKNNGASAYIKIISKIQI